MASKSAERKEPVTRGTGNVFADLGFPDAAERQARLRLAYALNQELEARKISQADAAKVLGVTQPKVSVPPADARGLAPGAAMVSRFPRSSPTQGGVDWPSVECRGEKPGQCDRASVLRDDDRGSCQPPIGRADVIAHRSKSLGNLRASGSCPGGLCRFHARLGAAAA